LKYQQGELRLQVQRMTGELPSPASQPVQPLPPGEAFVPLQSLTPRRATGAPTAPAAWSGSVRDGDPVE
jgi:hypothetical protein